METKLIIGSLKQAISELQYEKYQQEKNGLAKAALNFVKILETKVNGLERSSDKCHIQNVSNSVCPINSSIIIEKCIYRGEKCSVCIK